MHLKPISFIQAEKFLESINIVMNGAARSHICTDNKILQNTSVQSRRSKLRHRRTRTVRLSHPVSAQGNLSPDAVPVRCHRTAGLGMLEHLDATIASNAGSCCRSRQRDLHLTVICARVCLGGRK
jgi:ribosome-associated protein YbcJ (S4-like RNA binding protein)